FLFTWLPLPLTSTRFPYTTLFRSARGVYAASAWANPCDFSEVPERKDVRTVKRPEGRAPLPKAHRFHGFGFGAGKAAGLSAGARDRKSTRLNSSHQIISYAVFCLK